jgi:hypothetical protein
LPVATSVLQPVSSRKRFICLFSLSFARNTPSTMHVYFIDSVPGGNQRADSRLDACRFIHLVRLLRPPKIFFRESFVQQKTLFRPQNWKHAKRSREDAERGFTADAQRGVAATKKDAGSACGRIGASATPKGARLRLNKLQKSPIENPRRKTRIPRIVVHAFSRTAPPNAECRTQMYGFTATNHLVVYQWTQALTLWVRTAS